MADNRITYNALHLQQELDWYSAWMRKRMQQLVAKDTAEPVPLPRPHKLTGSNSVYQQFITAFKLTPAERFIVLLGLIPHIQPRLIDNLVLSEGLDKNQVATLGGIAATQHNGFLPTGETALFFLAGHHLQQRLEYALLFHPEAPFYKRSILRLENPPSGEPDMSGLISLSKEVQTLLTLGASYDPPFTTQFPARKISTTYTWKDLVLPADTLAEIEEIKTWVENKDALMSEWGFDKKFNSGYKCLFYGPPGTGKSLTAALLGKTINTPVYRIDLSMVVSKYIGETEKNLAAIFDMAMDKNWILFFDEADALFGKRSNISNAHDRFANQEVSYLLMRMEEYNGIAILATNLRSNLDDAFSRRFQSIVHFPLPAAPERLHLWQQGFSKKSILHETVNLEKIAADFPLSGANIMNVIRYASMMALRDKHHTIHVHYLYDGIRKEFHKEGKTI